MMTMIFSSWITKVDEYFLQWWYIDDDDDDDEFECKCSWYQLLWWPIE